jgi:hypothetical protein
MASENAEKVKNQLVEDPELLIEMAVVFTKARVKARVDLTYVEKAEVLESLATAIRNQSVTGF